MIESAGSYAATGAPAGLSVMSAALNFAMSSRLSPGITDQLTVPVTVTLTTTPDPISVPEPAPTVTVGAGRNVAALSAATHAASANSAAAALSPSAAVLAASRGTSSTVSKFTIDRALLAVGQGGNTPTTTPGSAVRRPGRVGRFRSG